MEESPMKCIVSQSGKTIERVKDDVAKTKVDSGKWNYTNKADWKQRVRNKSTAEVSTDTEVVEKVHGLKAKDRKKQK